MSNVKLKYKDIYFRKPVEETAIDVRQVGEIKRDWQVKLVQQQPVKTSTKYL